MTTHASQRIWTWITLLILLATAGAQAQEMPASVTYGKEWLNKTRVHVVTVDLTDPTIQVKPAIAYDRIGRRQSFIGFMAQNQPLAQISGSYFSLRDALPIGDIVVDGKLRFNGAVGSALALRPDNTADIVNIPYGWAYSWPEYDQVLQGGMRLVQNGKYAVYPKNQGFKDPGLFRRATRTAVGLRPDQKLLLVAVNKEILLSELAAIMKALGCRDAMTLDGGTSTGMAYGSEVILAPNRTLANVLMVVQRPALEIEAATLAPVKAAEGTRLLYAMNTQVARETKEERSDSSDSLANPPRLRYSNGRENADRPRRWALPGWLHRFLPG